MQTNMYINDTVSTNTPCKSPPIVCYTRKHAGLYAMQNSPHGCSRSGGSENVWLCLAQREYSSSSSHGSFEMLFLAILPNYLSQKYNTKAKLPIPLDTGRRKWLLQAAVQHASLYRHQLQPPQRLLRLLYGAKDLALQHPQRIYLRQGHSSVLRQYPPVYITRPRVFFLLHSYQ